MFLDKVVDLDQKKHESTWLESRNIKRRQLVAAAALALKSARVEKIKRTPPKHSWQPRSVQIPPVAINIFRANPPVIFQQDDNTLEYVQKVELVEQDEDEQEDEIPKFQKFGALRRLEAQSYNWTNIDRY